jgi:hypothetical protein
MQQRGAPRQRSLQAVYQPKSLLRSEIESIAATFPPPGCLPRQALIE